MLILNIAALMLLLITVMIELKMSMCPIQINKLARCIILVLVKCICLVFKMKRCVSKLITYWMKTNFLVKVRTAPLAFDGIKQLNMLEM